MTGEKVPTEVGNLIPPMTQGIFQRYMHPPTGFFSMESLDIPGSIRMLRQSFDMFADYPVIFLGEFPDELFNTIFDVDPHNTPVFRARVLSSLHPTG